jgi:prolyl-tRNA synthetase
VKLSKYFFHSLKEAPGDADIESQKLFTRANFKARWRNLRVPSSKT